MFAIYVHGIAERRLCRSGNHDRYRIVWFLGQWIWEYWSVPRNGWYVSALSGSYPYSQIPRGENGQVKVKLELSEIELRRLIIQYFENKLGELKLDESKLQIEVKSKQNYKSEWEKADFRAVYEHYEG